MDGRGIHNPSRKVVRPKHGCHCDHTENRFEAIIDLIQEAKRELLRRVTETAEKSERLFKSELKKTEDRMAQTMEDVKAAAEEVTGIAGELKDSVQALIDKAASGGGESQDQEPTVNALNELRDVLNGIKDSVDAALNAGEEQPPQPEQPEEPQPQEPA